MEYLVAYDISDPKRLRRVAKVMETYGYRVQKSVFECDLSQSGLAAMQSAVLALLDPLEDSVRIYPLYGNSRRNQTILGRGGIAPIQPCLVVA